AMPERRGVAARWRGRRVEGAAPQGRLQSSRRRVPWPAPAELFSLSAARRVGGKITTPRREAAPPKRGPPRLRRRGGPNKERIVPMTNDLHHHIAGEPGAQPKKPFDDSYLVRDGFRQVARYP